MKSASETLLNKAEDQVEASGRKDQAEPSATLVELAKVTETKGSFFGVKFDTGAGLQVY